MDYGNLLIDSIPGAIVGSMLGLVIVGVHKVCTNEGNAYHDPNLVGTRHLEHRNHVQSDTSSSPYYLLSFHPVAFDIDRLITKQFLSLQEFRNLAPELFDQAGRGMDKFLGRYKGICNFDPMLIYSPTFMQDTMQLLSDIYTKLDSYQQVILERFSVMKTDSKSLSNIEETIHNNIDTIDRSMKQYVRAMEQKIIALYRNLPAPMIQSSAGSPGSTFPSSSTNTQTVNVAAATPTTTQANAATSTPVGSFLSKILPPDFKTNQVHGALADVGKSILQQFIK